MVVNVTNIFQKMKNESLLSTENILQNERNCFIIIIKTICFKTIYKNGKIIHKIWWDWNWRIWTFIDIDVNEIVKSNIIFLLVNKDFKYFIDYKCNKEMRPLFLFFPEMCIYKRYCDKTKYMYFMIKDENIFGKYRQFEKTLTV